MPNIGDINKVVNEKIHSDNNVRRTYYADSALKNKLNSDKLEINDKKFDYSIDDGKISFKDKIKHFGKGIISPVTSMFSSTKNFLIGATAIAAGAALIAATGGAAAPVLVGLGVAGGAVQLGVNAHKAKNAKTDDEAKQAWEGMGSGVSTAAISVAGAKSALKTAKIETTNLNPFSAVLKCIKETPKCISKSFNNIKSGNLLVNLGIKKQASKPEAKLVDTAKTEVTKQVNNASKVKESPVSGEFWEDNPGMDSLRYDLYEKAGAYELIDERSVNIKRTAAPAPIASTGELSFDYQSLDNLKIQNLTLTTDQQGVRGSCILNKANKKFIPDLKEAGIEQVIDLRSEGNSLRAAETCARNGLEYTKFSINYDSPMTQEEISALPKFIQALRKGKYYIGCNEGTNRTDVATGLGYVFDPQAKTIPVLRSQNTQKVLSMLRKACNEILLKDKKTGQFGVSEEYIKSLGWKNLEAFFAEFQTRLAKIAHNNLN